MAAPRSIGSLTVSFGLVAIPVKLYTATQSAERDLLQHAAQGLRLAPEAAVRLPQGRLDRRARRNGQGLRVRQGPVRAVHARGDQGARRGRHALGGDLGVRAGRVDRSGVLRQDVLPLARQGRRQAVRAADRSDEGSEARGRRPLGDARQGIHRADPADQRRADDAAAALRSRRAAVDRSRDSRRPK